MESLPILKKEQTKLQQISRQGSTILAKDAVKGTALICNPCKEQYNILIGKSIAKMFFLHGKQYNQDKIEIFLNAIIESYEYETPETILLFFKKAGNGDFGKFYGDPDIGTIREWFSTYLGSVIVPERERQAQQRAKEADHRFKSYDNKRGETKRINELNKGPQRFTPVRYEKEAEEKGRRL